MPKIKTHRGAAKRIKLSRSGKLLRQRAFKNHNLGKKSSSRKREYGKDHKVRSADEKNVKKMLGV